METTKQKHKGKVRLTPGDEVRLPSGKTGIFVEEEFGELRFVTDGRDEYYFMEDLDLWNHKKSMKQ